MLARTFLPSLLLLVACDSASSSITSCKEDETLVNGVCIEDPRPATVHLSSVGFRTDRGKRGTYVGGPVEGAGFSVKSAADGSVVFSGQASAEIDAPDSAEVVHVVDFRDLQEPGEYYVEVNGSAPSEPFWIADDVYVEPFRAVMLGMYGQRCGQSVYFEWQGQPFEHGECHHGDAAPLGWHDAGDYGKYTNNGAFSLGMMLFAWDHFRDKLEGFELEIPERGGDLPDYLDECRFQLDWLFAMQDAATGGVADRITTANFDGLSVSPERSTNPRNMAPVSTQATADFAAVMAHASRVFEPYDAAYAERLRDSALAAWQFLLDNPTQIAAVTMGFTGSYRSGDLDDRLWAAAEIFEITGDADALAYFEARDVPGGFQLSPSWDWSDLTTLAIFTYLDSTREERNPDLVTDLTNRIDVTSNSLAMQAMKHAYGRSLGTYYEWGVNGMIARTTMALSVAARLAIASGEDDGRSALYLDAAAMQLDHLFGRNYFGRSFVTGVGFDPPLFPHHRPSVADGIEPPWPGLLVGGPSRVQDMNNPAMARQWFDDIDDFTSNEIAINWNAPLVYALVAFLP
ncbi:MAG TPA: glycoside hydrolase family 9 protein [Polyangiaceae bacterium]